MSSQKYRAARAEQDKTVQLEPVDDSFQVQEIVLEAEVGRQSASRHAQAAGVEIHDPEAFCKSVQERWHAEAPVPDVGRMVEERR